MRGKRSRKRSRSRTRRRPRRRIRKRKTRTSKKNKRNRRPKRQMIHEGYYLEKSEAQKVAKRLGGRVVYHRHGLYAGSYEVFAPLPLKYRIKERLKRIIRR